MDGKRRDNGKEDDVLDGRNERSVVVERNKTVDFSKPWSVAYENWISCFRRGRQKGK